MAKKLKGSAAVDSGEVKPRLGSNFEVSAGGSFKVAAVQLNDRKDITVSSPFIVVIYSYPPWLRQNGSPMTPVAIMLDVFAFSPTLDWHLWFDIVSLVDLRPIHHCI